MEVDAFAKINLFLAVVGKREDGYHELETVMQTLSLHDRLTIQTCDGNNAESLVTLSTNLPNLVTNDKNLVVKAAKRFMQATGLNQPITIKLDKRIPMGAGLGGGSSDAAATLLGLNKLFNANLPMETLMDMGAALGADVPFCLHGNMHGGAALAKGIGEKLTPLPPAPNPANPNLRAVKKRYHTFMG
ncbi:MAG: 4-(cytidine 5'-diphospho)-2-C-methyl-D-erythritol kinase [Defluviitaleaceae bacterium]|nr:4-(cytidine 5'-diphospho)-2-C-methyl-D-erythritol kinase [Defluviitaleaceae bacterium]